MKKWILKYGWIIPLIVFIILATAGSRLHSPWDDEAETLLFGKSILTHGVPYGWDGTNLMGFNDAVVLNSNLINHVSPWPQYYVAAFGEALFGVESYTSVRFVFLLFGVASVYLLYKSMEELGSTSLALWTIVTTSLSVTYILFSYQIRYYSLSLFFGTLFLWGVIRLLKNKPQAMVLLLIGGIGGIYSHYVSFLFYAIALGVSGILYAWRERCGVKRFVIFYFWIMLVVGLAFLPWYHVLNPSASEVSHVDLRELFTSSPWFSFYSALSMTNGTNTITFGFMGFAFLWFLWRIKTHKKLHSTSMFIGGTIVMYLLIASFVDGVSYSVTSFIAFRYQVIVLPLYMGIIALVIDDLWQWYWMAGIVGFFLFIVSTFAAFQSPHILLYDYIQEMYAPTPQPDLVVANYLKVNAKDGDTVFATLDRDYDPLQYLLGTKMKYVNRVKITNTRLFPKNRYILPRYIYAFLEEPDWVIQFSKRPYDSTYFTSEFNEIPKNIDLVHDYTLTILPVFFSDVSRPEIFWHMFYPVSPLGAGDQVFVYHKMR